MSYKLTKNDFSILFELVWMVGTVILLWLYFTSNYPSSTSSISWRNSKMSSEAGILHSSNIP